LGQVDGFDDFIFGLAFEDSPVDILILSFYKSRDFDLIWGLINKAKNALIFANVFIGNFFARMFAKRVFAVFTHD
jgi:hypothetical protein